jgi:pyruvate/2-oxoglutarate dehydrogenase complex dihydrolipoamide acyltransferase (E2) component
VTVRRKHPDSIDSPVIDIQADVKAKSVRFADEPETDVEIRGEAKDRTREAQPEVEGGSATERENIPDEVEPEVTYRDVRVRWHAAATITDPKEFGERRRQRRAQKHHATEAAMRQARELGLDLDEIEGTGTDRRITVRDVQQASEEREPPQKEEK